MVILLKPFRVFRVFLGVSLILFFRVVHLQNPEVCTTPQCYRTEWNMLLLPPLSKNRHEICCHTAGASTAQMLRENMNPSMNPCHDFYEFVCGKYKYHHPIPPHDSAWGQFSARMEKVDEEALALLKGKEENPHPILQKARDSFASCMDEESIEKYGDLPIPMHLNKVGLPMKPPFNTAVNEPINFSRMLAKLHRYTLAEFLFHINVAIDFKERETNRLNFGSTPIATKLLLQSEGGRRYTDIQGLIIETNTPNKSEETAKEEFHAALKEYMTSVILYMYECTYTKFSKNTMDIVSRRIDDVISFMLAVEEKKDPVKKDRVIALEGVVYTTVPELQRKTDELLKDAEIKINWLEYVETLFEGIENVRESLEKGELIMIEEMNHLEGVLKILSTVPPKILLSSIWWMAAESAVFASTSRLRKSRIKFQEKINKRITQPREKICLHSTKSSYGYIIGHQLTKVENSFEHRHKVIQMIEEIKQCFGTNVEESEWLDDATKMAALNKLDFMTSIVSFPDWITDPDELDFLYGERVVFKDSFFLTHMTLKRNQFDCGLSWIHKKNSYGNPFPQDLSIVNASYMFLENVIDIPIGILGFPFYDLGLEAMNYGAIGVILGHELIHGYDNYGKNYDSWGVSSNWWDEETVQYYDKRAKCFVQSYSKFYLQDAKTNVDGQLTLGENIADNGGFAQSLKAYREYVSYNGPEPKLPGFENLSHEKLFTIAFANTVGIRMSYPWTPLIISSNLKLLEIHIENAQQAWCVNAKPDFLKWLIKFDEHAPNVARVNGVAKNSEEFSQIWGCQPNDRLNREEKCKLW